MGFSKLTPINGFDFKDLNNARQNNYAWSMSELGDFIYTGTGRNILLNIIKAIEPGTQIPALINPNTVDNLAEIWRYKKDEKLPWECVYKAPVGSGITGFRFMIQHTPFGGSPALYAAAFGASVKVLKTTNGVNWFILPDNLEGTSSRAMITHNGKLYLATIDEANPSPVPLLYSSKDPEFYPWELVIDNTASGFDSSKNPVGAISNMSVFNNRIYVATSNSDGAQVWRTNAEEPKLNDWTLIVDKGFGNPANKYTLSIGVFKNHLYVSGTKQLPLAWFIPMGFDIIRIDKHDNWELIVGGNPFIPPTISESEESRSRTGIGSGFNNPFNVYAWQIQEYKGKLFISTFDDSSNMEVILTTLLANRDALSQLIGETITNILIEVYKSVVEILRAIKYPIGFDLYVSGDGVNFRPVFLNGLKNPNNYGGRILFVDEANDLFIGTANPFQGCEVWKADDAEKCKLRSCYENDYKNDYESLWEEYDIGKRNAQSYYENNYRSLWKARELLNEKYSIIVENMPAILKFMSNKYYQNFTKHDE